MTEDESIHIKVEKDDSEEVKRLKKELEEERITREDYEVKLTILAEKKLREKAKELGVPDDVEVTAELLKGYEMAKEKENAESNVDSVGKGAGGVVRLTREQIMKEKGIKGFTEGKYEASKEGFKAMIEDLRKVEKEADPENSALAKAVLDELLKKALVPAIKEQKQVSGEVEAKLGLSEEIEKKIKKGEDKK